MKTTTTTTTKGVWQADVQPSSLIINFFEITDIIGKNTQKVSCLLNNIKKEISTNNIKNNVIAIADHGVNWLFDVTIDSNGNYGLLFTGLSK